MDVRVEIQFEHPSEEDWQASRAIARSLTNKPDSVRVTADPERPDWLIVEFTMPTKAQYKAVDKIDAAVRYHAWNRLDSIICFPRRKPRRARTRQ